MIEAVIFTALKGLVANRCYPSTFPQTPEGQLATRLPAIRYSVISVEPMVDVCGTDDVSTDDTHIQVDAIAASHPEALTLRDQIIAALMNTDPPCAREGGFVTFDEATRTHRVVLDYVFSPSSEVTS